MPARERPRHAFVIHDPQVVEPLGTPAGETWLVDRPARAYQAAILEAHGLTVQPIGTVEEATELAAAAPAGAIVTYDSVVLTRAVLRGLLDRYGAGVGGAITAALPDGMAPRRYSNLGGLDPIKLGGVDAFAGALHAVAPGGKLGDAEPVLLPFKEHVIKFPIPVGMMGKGEGTFAASDAILVRVGHWSHVLKLNFSVYLAGWMERWQTPLGRLWFAWRALLGFPWRRGRLLGAIKRVHRKAKVHHRAHVELSVIEEGAEIGPNCVVKNSYIGKGARLDDGAIVNLSVIGEGAFVSNASTVFNCVVCPGAFAAQAKMQFSLLGEQSAALTGSGFYDLNFERNVRVPFRGSVADSGERFLGVCLGPRARVGGSINIMSGRSLPAGALLVQPPDQILHKVDDTLATSRRITVQGGVAVDAGPLPPPES